MPQPTAAMAKEATYIPSLRQSDPPAKATSPAQDGQTTTPEAEPAVCCGGTVVGRPQAGDCADGVLDPGASLSEVRDDGNMAGGALRADPCRVFFQPNCAGCPAVCL